MMTNWKSEWELNTDREPSGGSAEKLREAIGQGADLRIYTAFRHNEHLQPESDNPELVDEVSELRTTYLIDERWAAIPRPKASGSDGFLFRDQCDIPLYPQNPWRGGLKDLLERFRQDVYGTRDAAMEAG